VRSIRNRLALLFAAITALAIAVIYFYVVPQLETRLRDEKLSSLAADARAYSGPLVSAIGTNVPTATLNRRVRRAADRSNARVTLLGVSRGTEGIQLYPISDSTDQANLEDLQFQIALEAVSERLTVTGSEASNTGRLGEAARPLLFDGKVARVVVFSAPLSDVTDDVAIVRRQILIAGAIALVLATLAGYLVARALSVRIKRLEQAAEKVAAGDFSERIPVDRDDELGQLALAFNDMQAQLKQLDDARKQFIATASHELRTPIFSLSGFVELLEEEEDLDEHTLRVFLGQIRDQTGRLRLLATDLLDLSRLEAGSLELRPEPVDVSDLAREVTSEFVPALQQHESPLSLDVPGVPLEAICDPERVAQIVRILMDNAISHTPQGTGIEVRAGRENGVVRLAVRDTGLGIKRAMLGRVFEPFFTSDARGSGLGLTIARELAERMDGRLAVESVPGRTTFTLEIPG
jgi:two-component system OmpR family sensor kinase